MSWYTMCIHAHGCMYELNMRESLQSIRWINIYCYKFYMHVWLTNLFSMANAPQYFLHRFLPFCALLLIHLHSLPLSTLFIPPVCACPSVKCEFTRKMNWNRLQIHILRRYGWLLYVHFICFFCPAKGYVNNKSKCLWVRSVAEREIWPTENCNRCIRNCCCNK